MNLKKRVKNLEEGRGFTIDNDLFGNRGGGVFEFASSVTLESFIGCN